MKICKIHLDCLRQLRAAHQEKQSLIFLSQVSVFLPFSWNLYNAWYKINRKLMQVKIIYFLNLFSSLLKFWSHKHYSYVLGDFFNIKILIIQKSLFKGQLLPHNATEEQLACLFSQDQDLNHIHPQKLPSLLPGISVSQERRKT